MNKVVLAGYARSAIGRLLGSLSESDPVDICAQVIRGGFAPEVLRDVDAVILGSALSGGMGQGPARQVALRAGISETVPATLISMVCGSGMQALAYAENEIRLGQAQAVLCGGFEFMSRAGFVMDAKVRQGQKMGNMTLADLMLRDGLTDAMHNVHMGITAENVAEKEKITRQMQDQYALTAQSQAIQAVDSGCFDGEIIPVRVKRGKKEELFARDEFPNRTTDAEKLAALRPAFKEGGTVTAGNSSGLNDGCAFLLLATEEFCQRHGLVPSAEIVAHASAGIDPLIMGLGPVPAIERLLKRTGIALSQVGCLELNEAFAAQALGCIQELSAQWGVDRETLLARTNLWGSGIGLGHPLGMTGARIAGTLSRRMQAEDRELGIASLCVGGGMGLAVLLKRMPA